MDEQEFQQGQSEEITIQAPDNLSLSTDPQAHDEALETLYCNVWHQNAADERTVSAIRFLIDRMQDAAVQDKDELLLLLAYIARGNSYIHTQEATQTAGTQEGNCVQSAYEAVREGIEVYLDLLGYEDAGVRMCAAYTLACFQEYAAAIIPVLHTHIATEEEEQARSSMLLSLGELSAEYDLPSRQLLLDVLRGEASNLVKVAAALALARRDHHETPLEALCVLIDTLIEAGPVTDRYLELPWTTTDVVDDICQVLYGLGPCPASVAVPMLLDAFSRATEHSSLRIADALLHLAFHGERINIDCGDPLLTPEQKLVLSIIANSDSAWILNIINQGEIHNVRRAA